MPKFIGTLAEVKLDAKRISNALDKEVRSILIEGIRAWLDVVTSIVPNWSGMSVASLQELGDKVGVTVNAFPISGVPSRVAEGRSLGSSIIRLKPGTYFFEWRTKVLQFIINEQFDARQWGFRLRDPGPYNTQKLALAAMSARIDPLLFNIVKKLGIKITIVARKI